MMPIEVKNSEEYYQYITNIHGERDKDWDVITETNIEGNDRSFSKMRLVKIKLTDGATESYLFNTVLKCQKCDAILKEDYKAKGRGCSSLYEFYRCPICNYENDFWIVMEWFKYVNLEPIVRAKFFESYLYNKEIDYDRIMLDIKFEYPSENFTIETVQNTLNNSYREHLVNRHIKAKRIPIPRMPDEKFYKIIISQNNNFEDFFNNRVIRPWHLSYFKEVDLQIFKRKIKENSHIRFKKRWLAAVDFFIDVRKVNVSN